MRVFLSNSLYRLFNHLKEELFSSGTSLFEQRILVVPSRPVEQWVRIQLADSLNIAAGFRSMQLHEASRLFLQHMDSMDPLQKHILLSPIEWSVVLEEEILQICREESEDPKWDSLLNYLKNKKSTRRLALCEHLGILFHKYVLYGGSFLTKRLVKPQDWQDHLLARFEKKNLLPLLERDVTISFDSPLSLHFFGFSHLSPFHSKLFQRGEAVSLYHLSPCKEFWSDVQSDRESALFLTKRKLPEKERLYWEVLIEDKHPLLANLGKVGRDFAKHIEEEDFITTESYEENEGSSYLTTVQREILNLEPSQLLKNEKDDSIQLHLATSKRREVEIIFHKLIELFTYQSIVPKDILIMAPAIEEYVPFIHGIFSSKVPYRLLEVPVHVDSHIGGIFQLFELQKRRWSSLALLELFQLPLFREHQGWGNKEIAKIHRWIDKGSIRWGIDTHHQEKLLSAKKIKNLGAGTWQAGFDHLFTLFTSHVEDGDEIQFSDAPLLASVWELLITLKNSLEPFFNNSLKTVREWSYELKQLDEQFFASSVSRESFFALCDRLERLSIHSAKGQFPFESILQWLIKLASQETTTFQPLGVEAVSFCSLLPMRAIPSKIICLLGMNEGAFPRKESFWGLNKMKDLQDSLRVPSQSDFDKQMFLEVLLSVKDKLIMTALTHHPQDQTPLMPSGIVLDLMNRLPPSCLFSHPHMPCAPIYFNRSRSGFSNFSLTDFEAASITEPLKKPFNMEVPVWANGSIDIADIRAYLRNPLSRTFKKIYGLGLTNPRKISEEEDFIVSSYMIESLLKKAEESFTPFIESKIRDLPRYPRGGFFRDVALEKLKKALSGVEKSLKNEQLFFVEFCLSQEEILMNGKRLVLPPLKIHVNDHTVFLRGKMEGLFQQGIIVGGANDRKGCYRSLLDLLLCKSHVDLQKFTQGNTLLFCRDGTERKIEIEGVDKRLRMIVEAFIASETAPLFLFSEWIDVLIARDEKKLYHLIEEKRTSKEVGASEIQWMYEMGFLPEPQEIIEKTSIFAERIFGGILDARI